MYGHEIIDTIKYICNFAYLRCEDFHDLLFIISGLYFNQLSKLKIRFLKADRYDLNKLFFVFAKLKVGVIGYEHCCRGFNFANFEVYDTCLCPRNGIQGHLVFVLSVYVLVAKN